MTTPIIDPATLTEEQRDTIRREIIDVIQLPDCTPNDIKLLCFGRNLAILTIFGSEFFHQKGE